MKKRSLVSAVAMLLVSALVLTSATFAWFAASASVTVQSFSATVENSNGGVLLSANNADWKTALVTDDYTAVATNFVPTTLDPVSGQVGGSAITFVGGTLTGTAFSASAATAGWVYYRTFVKAQVAGALTVTPGFTTASDFVYYAISAQDDETSPTILQAPMLLAKQGDAFTPIVSSSGTATDNAATDGIISATEAGAGSVSLAAAPQTAAASASQNFVINMLQDDVIVLDVWMWAEGQDGDCVGNVTTQTSKSAMVLSYAATTP